MKFSEFRSEIIKAYTEKFPCGYCAVELYKCLGLSITIDCHISENGRCGNDMMHICLRIELPDKFNIASEELPDNLTVEAWRNYYLTIPENKYMVYGTNKAYFRKSNGTAEKVIDVIKKYFSRLHDSIRMDYINGRIHKDHVEYVKANI